MLNHELLRLFVVARLLVCVCVHDVVLAGDWGLLVSRVCDRRSSLTVSFIVDCGAPGASGVSDLEKVSRLAGVLKHRNDVAHGGVGRGTVDVLTLLRWLHAPRATLDESRAIARSTASGIERVSEQFARQVRDARRLAGQSILAALEALDFSRECRPSTMPTTATTTSRPMWWAKSPGEWHWSSWPQTWSQADAPSRPTYSPLAAPWRPSWVVRTSCCWCLGRRAWARPCSRGSPPSSCTSGT